MAEAITLAQSDLRTLSDSDTIQVMVSALIVCGIIGRGFQLMRGETSHAVHILLDALFIGGSVVIAKAFF